MSGAPAGPGTIRSSEVTLGLGGISRAASSWARAARRCTMSGMELTPPGMAASSWSRGSRTSGWIRSRRDMKPSFGLTTDAECILRSGRAHINARFGQAGPSLVEGRAHRKSSPKRRPGPSVLIICCSTRREKGGERPGFGGPRPVVRARCSEPASNAAPDRIRCRQLLATVPVGRVSFFADGEIVVLPVNHVLDGQDPVFLTARGSKLSAAEGQDLVAFEADDYDERTQSGWSVLVNGRAQAVYEDAEIQRLSHLGLHPWVTAMECPFWIRIRPTSISGRQTPGPG